MAKNTHAQEAATGTSDSFTEHELSDPVPPIQVTRAVLGGELLSVGNNSEASTEKQSKTNESENQPPRQPAQTTENPSNQPGKETGSNATLTGGSGHSKPARQSGRKATPAKKANVRTTDPDFDEFD